MTPRKQKRTIEGEPQFGSFGPEEQNSTGQIFLKLGEYEALRLKDHLGLSQKEAAEKMEVSQPTFHRILRAGRKKTAMALAEGKTLVIEGGDYRVG
ncbi:MAG: DUF134 domain-containing protein [bacterium]